MMEANEKVMNEILARVCTIQTEVADLHHRMNDQENKPSVFGHEVTGPSVFDQKVPDGPSIFDQVIHASDLPPLPSKEELRRQREDERKEKLDSHRYKDLKLDIEIQEQEIDSLKRENRALKRAIEMMCKELFPADSEVSKNIFRAIG